MSPLSSTSTWVTVIRPAVITAPLQAAQVDLGELDVTWNQTAGADEYLIWLSADPNFSRPVRFGPFNNEIPVDQGGPATITQRINAQVRQLAGARSVFIAVGAQNSQDATNPQPRGHIFSTPVSVTPETIPPPPPGAAVAGLGGNGLGRRAEKRVVAPKK